MGISTSASPVCGGAFSVIFIAKAYPYKMEPPPPTVTCRYDGQLRTENRHIRSGDRLLTDAPVDNRGKGEAFSPTDLMATALLSCILTVLGIKQEDGALPPELTLEGEVWKTMTNEPPRRIAELHVEIYLYGAILSDAQKALVRKTAESCPVALSLHPSIRQDLNFHFRN